MNKISKEVIENVIGGNSYQHSKVDGWSNQITKDILEQLIKHSKPFKYVGELMFSFVEFCKGDFMLFG